MQENIEYQSPVQKAVESLIEDVNYSASSKSLVDFIETFLKEQEKLLSDD
jgi:Tfp pilus assembly protein PilO